jgi:tRNA(adenine34) deaminase
MPNRFPASHRLSRCIKASGPAQGGRDGDDLEMVASFMDMALAEARAAGEAGEVPVGCVVVCEGAVVARAGNRTLTERDPTAHAELIAIRAAAAALGSERLDGCDLYVTLEPCAMCAGAVAFARIRRLYYGAADPKGGAVENGVKFFASPSCHHRPEVYGGLAEADASALLKQFFQARR